MTADGDRTGKSKRFQRRQVSKIRRGERYGTSDHEKRPTGRKPLEDVEGGPDKRGPRGRLHRETKHRGTKGGR